MAESIDSKSLQLLIDLLKSEAACLRGAGAFGLSLLGPDAKPAVQALSEALGREDDADVARAIVWAIEDVGLEAAPGLVPGLKHPNAEIREASSEALRTLAMDYRENGVEVSELTAAFALVPELRDLMIPLGEHLGLPPRTVEEVMASPDDGRDTFQAVARKRELANVLKATKSGRKGPH
jgi:hypothetical protein